MSSPDYIVDIPGVKTPASGAGDASRAKPGPRPWLAIRWRCCKTYSRVYRNRDGTAYVGHCPKCAKPVRVNIGPGGTGDRFFEAN